VIRLAIIRHGHTRWNRAGRIQGHRDVPLDAAAVDELAACRLPTEWNRAALVASPLSRAVETAELISGRKPQIVNALIEMDFGDWEGQRSVVLGADSLSGFRHLSQWGWDYRPPNGESPADVWQRLQPWLNSLQQDTVAVCHIGVMRTLLAIAHDWPFRGQSPFTIKRKQLYCLLVDEHLHVAVPPQVRLVSSP